MPERSPAAFIDVLGRGGSPDPNEYGYGDSDSLRMMNAFFMNDQSVIDKYVAFMEKRKRERLLREKQMKEAQGMATGARVDRKKKGALMAPTPPPTPTPKGDFGAGVDEITGLTEREKQIKKLEAELGI